MSARATCTSPLDVRTVTMSRLPCTLRDSQEVLGRVWSAVLEFESYLSMMFQFKGL